MCCRSVPDQAESEWNRTPRETWRADITRWYDGGPPQFIEEESDLASPVADRQLFDGHGFLRVGCAGIHEGAEACGSCFGRVVHTGYDPEHEIYRSEEEVVWDATQGWTSPLIVPAGFEKLSSTLPSRGQGPPTQEEKAAIEELLMPFLEAMIRGIQVTLQMDPTPSSDSSDGISAIATLTADLSHLVLARMSMEHRFGVESIKWVRSPSKTPGRHLEGLCADMRFDSGRFVRLSFDRPDQCAFFTMCMRFVVKAAKARGAK